MKNTILLLIIIFYYSIGYSQKKESLLTYEVGNSDNVEINKVNDSIFTLTVTNIENGRNQIYETIVGWYKIIDDTLNLIASELGVFESVDSIYQYSFNKEDAIYEVAFDTIQVSYNYRDIIFEGAKITSLRLCFVIDEDTIFTKLNENHIKISKRNIENVDLQIFEVFNDGTLCSVVRSINFNFMDGVYEIEIVKYGYASFIYKYNFKWQNIISNKIELNGVKYPVKFYWDEIVYPVYWYAPATERRID
ncbi:MAG: hypothetical protein COA33_014630 [Fluviicola sp.]|nr:hypothetical protein [Fluviicola sp.]